MPKQNSSTLIAMIASAVAGTVLGAATLGLAQPGASNSTDNTAPPPISQERIDAAMQRLRERQEARRHAATQPTTQQAGAATQPTGGTPAAAALTARSRALAEENQRLRDEVARLMDENNRLRQQLADATSASSEQARTASGREDNYDHQNSAPADNFSYGGYYNPPIFIIPGGVSLGGIPSTQPIFPGTSTGTRPPDDRNPLQDNANAGNAPSMPNHVVNPPPDHTINPPPNTVVNPPRHQVVNPPRNVVVNPPRNVVTNPPRNHAAPVPRQPQNPPANHAGSTAR